MNFAGLPLKSGALFTIVSITTDSHLYQLSFPAASKHDHQGNVLSSTPLNFLDLSPLIIDCLHLSHCIALYLICCMSLCLCKLLFVCAFTGKLFLFPGLPSLLCFCVLQASSPNLDYL